MSLTGKIALVTGASRGIGHAILLGLADMGATVVGTATSDIGTKNISTALTAKNYAGGAVIMDVRDDDSVAKALVAVEETYGAPAIVVNNAGITADNLFLRMKMEEWQSVINANLTALYRVTKPCLRAMLKAHWGRIINISSVSGIAGNPGQANYAAAKAGMIGFTKALAIEVASRNITVNAIAPGFICTDMTSALTQEQQTQLKTTIPMQRIGTPEEIAAAVCFLASPGASYITGETLQVNGGMYMQ
ncbi:MAG: 3-oxoacyl-ACP reductase FabG [Gammaproteobacteria bacterium]|nr:3-oxoacyl-ACP reductase FabG [Gammaproteobacteria bacterium]